MRDRFDLTGKRALVTGGSRGLGRAISLAFAEYGASVIVVSRKLENCEILAAEIRRRGGSAQAIACHVGRWAEIDALVDAVLALNFKGPFRLSALVGSRMAAGEGGSIINVSSIGAIRPTPEIGPYAGAKAALDAITTAHAFEFGPKVRVNAILPGSFRTDIAKHWAPDKEAKTQAVAGRFGEPDEIATTALYLASDHSRFTTGAMIRVDGGRP